MRIFEAYAGKKWTYNPVARRYVYILETLSYFQSDSPNYSYETLWRNEKGIIAYHGKHRDDYEGYISLCLTWSLFRGV